MVGGQRNVHTHQKVRVGMRMGVACVGVDQKTCTDVHVLTFKERGRRHFVVLTIMSKQINKPSPLTSLFKRSQRKAIRIEPDTVPN